MDCGVNCHYQKRGPPPPASGPFQFQGSNPCEESEDLNSVIVDVGQVDEQVATLWWALAQQTARVARRCTGYSNTTLPPVVDAAIRSTPSGSSRNAWAPVTSFSSSRPAPSPEPTYSITGCIAPRTAVVDLTPSRCNSSTSTSTAGTTTSISDTMSTTPMSSPRLVREVCEKFPAAASAPAAASTEQSTTYAYETPTDSQDGVQLLRYSRVSQSASVDQLPTSETNLRGSIRRPKSEVALRKFSDSSGQQLDDASSSADCVQYESQDLTTRDDDDLAAAYSPIVVVVSFVCPLH